MQEAGVRNRNFRKSYQPWIKNEYVEKRQIFTHGPKTENSPYLFNHCSLFLTHFLTQMYIKMQSYIYRDGTIRNQEYFSTKLLLSEEEGMNFYPDPLVDIALKRC